MREYLYQHDFMEIHTPKLIGTASESGSDVFEVKYFDRLAYLAQSPQFYKQMAMASGFNRIFEVGPVFEQKILILADMLQNILVLMLNFLILILIMML